MLPKPFAVALISLTAWAAPAVHAQDEPVQPRMHVVQPGETLTGLIRKLYPNSPLRENLLQDAVRASNPQAFMVSKPNILLAGASIKVPDHMALMEQQYKRFAPPAGDDASGEDPQRKWVRFP